MTNKINFTLDSSQTVSDTYVNKYSHGHPNAKDRSHAVIFSNDGTSAVPDFDDVQISTMTVIAHTNLTINTEKFFKYIPITDYTLIRKKRGRKCKIQPEDPNKDIPPGSIISLKKRRCIRGAVLKTKKVKSKKYWKHSVSAVMMLEGGKMVNVKVPHNGKLQMTGCKTVKHAVEFVKNMYSLMIETEEWTGETLFTYRDEIDETDLQDESAVDAEGEDSPQDLKEIEPELVRPKNDGLVAYFKIAMKNIDFHVGYKIRRDFLNEFINFQTDFRSIFESSMGPSVNIKIKANDRFDDKLSRLRITAQGECIHDVVTYGEFYTTLSPNDQKDAKKSEKYHTFLCFASGSIIMSSSGKEMSTIFYKLVRLLIDHRNKLEDKPDNKHIDSSWLDADEDMSLSEIKLLTNIG